MLTHPERFHVVPVKPECLKLMNFHLGSLSTNLSHRGPEAGEISC